ncbi:hypothetical protein Bca4012_044649 [Brassica carinata]
MYRYHLLILDHHLLKLLGVNLRVKVLVPNVAKDLSASGFLVESTIRRCYGYFF